MMTVNCVMGGYLRAMMNVSATQPPGSDGDRSIGGAAGAFAVFAATPKPSARQDALRHDIARRSHRTASRLAAFLAICSAWVAVDARQ
jgi:hypothetical protein